MNPLFNNPHQRGSSIYNICAPKTMMFGSCPTRFSDSYYKHLSTNFGNQVMAMESMGSATPTKGILDSVQGIFMNVLKISPNNQSHQQNHQVKPKEFNFNYQNHQSGSNMKATTPTSPIKIDPKQAGKAVWTHTPTKSPVDISTFTIVSPVASTCTFFDLETHGSGNTHKDEDPSNESAPNNLDLNHMQTISEEEDKEKEESQQEKVKQIIMAQEPVVTKDSKAAAEAKRLKEINKCKHRFNPLKINHKDPRKNIKEKWRRKIEKDILEDCSGDIAALNLNDSLESLDIEQVHSTDNIARSQAVPIPNSKSNFSGYSAEEFPSIRASSSLSVSAQNHHLPEFEDEDEYVVLNSDTPKSTPIHSPRKSMKLCERFNRLFHNHSKSISPGTSPSTIMIPIRPRERQMSECSEDSFIVFFDPDSVDNPPSSSYINEYIEWGQVEDDDDDDDDEETEEEEDSDDSEDGDETEEENDEESASEAEQEAEPERNIQFDLEAENLQQTPNGHSKSDDELNQALESLEAGSSNAQNGEYYIKKKRRRLDGDLKVRFDTEPKVHVIRAWNYAYRAARKGPWEQIARDTERFKLRCLGLERMLAPVLSQVHRDRIYQQRFMNSDSTLDGDNGNDANEDDSDHEPVEK